MAWTVDGLAIKPYPGGQGEIGFGSTSGGLCGVFVSSSYATCGLCRLSMMV